MNDNPNFPVAAARHVVRKAKKPRRNILTVRGLRHHVAEIWAELALDTDHCRDMRKAVGGRTLIGEAVETFFWKILADNQIDVSDDRDLASVDADLSQILTGVLAPGDELDPGCS